MRPCSRHVNNVVAYRSRLCDNVAMSYTASVTKEPALGIRLELDEKAALDRAAKADQRTLSAMGRKIIADWLRANGWLGGAHPSSSNTIPPPVKPND